MPILNYTDQRTPKGRLVVLGIYASLLVGGVAMIYPFMVTLTGSVSNSFDYERRDWVPRWLWSREDRFMRVLVTHFPPEHRGAIRQMRMYFDGVPEDWQMWLQIGDDRKGSDAWARRQLARLDDPAGRKHLEARVRDYGEFNANWNPRESVLAYDQRYVSPFLRHRYEDLATFNKTWEVSVDDFSQINASEWSGEPIDQPSYVPLVDVRYRDLLDFRRDYRRNRFHPYLKGTPAAYLRPAALRFLWEDYVAANAPNLQSAISNLKSLPFPVPTDAPAPQRALWLKFLQTDFPVRHFGIEVTPARQAAFRAFLVERFRNIGYLNRVLETSVTTWDEIQLTPTCPAMPVAQVWMDFVRTEVPVEERTIRDTLPELAFQRFALKRHGSLAAINEAYGLKLASLEQLQIPFGEALLVTFARRERAFTADLLTGNFRTVFDYLIHRGRAIPNTVILVALALLITLTVNPLAAYALSRFRLRSTERIIVFCLATMAFPAAVAAIPGFLLLRDLGLLNTFAALVLPGAANGMSIFLLKGFFDSLPQELYEAAAIDGAPEYQVFWRISLPLVKPILAVNMLNAFIAAYNGWEWAIIVCQDKQMWTVAVWTYQFYQTLGSQPYIVMAAFIANSLPVLIVFLACQKIILRGIILPQMK
jgi:multiple sugar transport system permease protein